MGGIAKRLAGEDASVAARKPNSLATCSVTQPHQLLVHLPGKHHVGNLHLGRGGKAHSVLEHRLQVEHLAYAGKLCPAAVHQNKCILGGKALHLPEQGGHSRHIRGCLASGLYYNYVLHHSSPYRESPAVSLKPKRMFMSCTA